MRKPLHHSWLELSDRTTKGGSAIVRLDFSGIFTEGSHEGTAFSGRIEYDASRAPTERHCSFAIFEEWPAPIVTMAGGGQVLTAQSASVYDGIDDGHGSRFDFVNIFGTGPFDHVPDAAYFEILFAHEGAWSVQGAQMPSTAQLQRMRVKRLSFGTNEPSNVISRGEFKLHAAS
jgi:hypothetical protein